ncbi:MAG: tRNA lysidine(34) synthetase TilS [Pseudomonadota bacterium]
MALAVSGGGDSVALLNSVTPWARARGAHLQILTVDHGLRPESSSEADAVEGASAVLNWPCKRLMWRQGAPAARRARVGRHSLLATACQEMGIEHLLLGHTLDDQLETVLIRARQGSGWYGLGGMDRLSPSPVWPAGEGLTLVRPLLDERRDALRAWLTDAGVRWIEDPTNEDAAYERVRVRRMLERAPGLRSRIAACLTHLSALRRAENLAMAASLETRVTAYPDASIDFDIDGLSEDRATRLLGWLVQAVAGAASMPRETVVRAALRSLSSGEAEARTLAGAWMVRGLNKTLSLYRDPGSIETAQSGTALFDARFARAPAGEAIQPRDRRAKRASPPAESGVWREMIGPRLAHLCSLWRHLPKLSHLDEA